MLSPVVMTGWLLAGVTGLAASSTIIDLEAVVVKPSLSVTE